VKILIICVYCGRGGKIINLSGGDEHSKGYINFIRENSLSGYYRLPEVIKCSNCGRSANGVSRYRMTSNTAMYPGLKVGKVYNMFGDYYGTAEEFSENEDYYSDEDEDEDD